MSSSSETLHTRQTAARKRVPAFYNYALFLFDAIISPSSLTFRTEIDIHDILYYSTRCRKRRMGHCGTIQISCSWRGCSLGACWRWGYRDASLGEYQLWTAWA